MKAFSHKKSLKTNSVLSRTQQQLNIKSPGHWFGDFFVQPEMLNSSILRPAISFVMVEVLVLLTNFNFFPYAIWTPLWYLQGRPAMEYGMVHLNKRMNTTVYTFNIVQDRLNLYANPVPFPALDWKSITIAFTTAISFTHLI